MENDTCVETYDFTDLEGTLSNFTLEQVNDYCQFYAKFSKFDTAIDQTLGYSMAITGAIGLVSYVLTYATFSDSSIFEGPSFVYHRSMALIELIHMAVMCQYGVLRILKFPGGSYSMIAWRDSVWGGWMIGDSAKLCINCLTTFVSLERTVAVWLPLKFERFNRYGIVAGAIAISCLIGSLQLTSLGSARVEMTTAGVYAGLLTEFGASQFYADIQWAIYFIKLTLGALIFTFCVLIAWGMYRSNKRVEGMSTDVQARWQLVKLGCYLQLIVAISSLIDHIAWVSFKIVDQPYPIVGRRALFELDSFEKAVTDLQRMKIRSIFEVIQVLAGEIDHGGRFYFYMIFHASFRESFIHMWKKIGKGKNDKALSGRRSSVAVKGTNQSLFQKTGNQTDASHAL